MIDLDEFLNRMRDQTRQSPFSDERKPTLFVFEFWDNRQGWICPLEIYDIHSNTHSVMYRSKGVIGTHREFSHYDSWQIIEHSTKMVDSKVVPLIRIKHKV